MRKWLKMLLLAGMFTVLLCGSALAAGESGICDVTEGLLRPQDANKNTVTTTVTSPEGKVYYPGAVRLPLEVNTQSNEEYLVFVLEGSESLAPTTENIVYIDQQTGNGGKITFDLYPSRLVNGKTYYIFLTKSSTSSTAPVGNFGYYAAFKLGDVNEDNTINIDDAMSIINHIVGRAPLSGNQLLAANADGKGSVNVDDAMAVINYIVGRITQLG